MRTVDSAATYTEVSLDDMEKFVRRGFHALHPKKGSDRGEVTIQLFLSQYVGIRILTSIPEHGSVGRGNGEDAIRVQLYHFGKNRPLMPGKPPIVKRTQGWRDSLQDKIEDMIEKYEDKEEDILAGKFIDWSK